MAVYIKWFSVPAAHPVPESGNQFNVVCLEGLLHSLAKDFKGDVASDPVAAGQNLDSAGMLFRQFKKHL